MPKPQPDGSAAKRSNNARNLGKSQAHHALLAILRSRRRYFK